MELSKYKSKAAELFEQLQDRLDEYEDAIDYDYGSAKLVIRFEQAPGVVYVINTQQAALQIWVAGEAKAWHFDWDEENSIWFDSKNEVELFAMLSSAFSRLTKERVQL